MSGPDRLERGYRRVLACYPRSFRRDSEDEIVAVLLATAGDGQRRVRVAEAADLIRGALRMRLRPPARPPRAVRGAVRLMCAGAVAELAAAVTIIVTAASVRAALATRPGLSPGLRHDGVAVLAFWEAGALVATAVCLVLAWALSQGRDPARFAVASFFALITLLMLDTLANHAAAFAPADTIAFAATWPIALAAAVLIFTRRSNGYYRQAAQQAVGS